jgi:hypothetical protein
MQNEAPEVEVLIKVRDANCLTDSELQCLSALYGEMQTRRELDALDSRWETEMNEFVRQRRGKRGKQSLELISRDQVYAGVLAGLAIAAYGGYMTLQFLQTSKPGDYPFVWLPLFFMGFLFAFGSWLIIHSTRTFGAVGEYERGHATYLLRRRQLTEKLPVESRLPVRYCPNCLTEVWLGSWRPGHSS